MIFHGGWSTDKRECAFLQGYRFLKKCIWTMTDGSSYAQRHGLDKDTHRLPTVTVAAKSCPHSSRHPGPKEMHSNPLPVKNSAQSPRVGFRLLLGPSLVSRTHSLHHWTSWTLFFLSWWWDCKKAPKILKLCRSLLKESPCCWVPLSYSIFNQQCSQCPRHFQYQCCWLV